MAATTTLLVTIKTSDLMLFEGILKKFNATYEIISTSENQEMDECPEYTIQGIEQ
ncbi:hypothetical protein [Lonepinella sp. MS14437]|uniref:hypothetical protein n=1 Tax=unclassified Lonepinella TaxID=2642006 RepID=UPI0036DB5AEB